jgi:hypothetical protein
MTPAEFMERLGSIDVGQAIADADRAATNAAQQAGTTAADAVNVVLKDVTQKFEAFGKEASVYFEGRARLLSVVVAMALAFLAHVDAVDLFRTYLRDPNARAKVIEQSEAGDGAAQGRRGSGESAEGDGSGRDIDLGRSQEADRGAEKRLEGSDRQGELDGQTICRSWRAHRLERRTHRAGEDVRAGLDVQRPEQERGGRLRVDLEELRARTNGEERYGVRCRPSPGVWFYLFLGGLLVGLGAPFWYNAVTGLTNIRNAARGTPSADAQTRAAVAAAGAGTTQPGDAGRCLQGVDRGATVKGRWAGWNALAAVAAGGAPYAVSAAVGC